MIPADEMIDALLALSSDEYELTDQELAFIDSVDFWQSKGRTLTDRQLTKLRELYQRACVEGR